VLDRIKCEWNSGALGKVEANDRHTKETRELSDTIIIIWEWMGVY